MNLHDIEEKTIVSLIVFIHMAILFIANIFIRLACFVDGEKQITFSQLYHMYHKEIIYNKYGEEGVELIENFYETYCNGDN